MRQITPLMRFVHIFFSLSFSFSFSSFSSSSSRPPPSDNPFLCLLFNWVTGPYLSTLHRNSMISLRSELANCARCFQRDTLMFFLITLMYLYIFFFPNHQLQHKQQQQRRTGKREKCKCMAGMLAHERKVALRRRTISR